MNVLEVDFIIQIKSSFNSGNEIYIYFGFWKHKRKQKIYPENVFYDVFFLKCFL